MSILTPTPSRTPLPATPETFAHPVQSSSQTPAQAPPQSTRPATPFLEWTETNVQNWLSSLGYSQYESEILDQGITGDVLPHLTHESLTELGIKSIGHRLGILKAIWQLKVDLGTGFGAGASTEGGESTLGMADNVGTDEYESISPNKEESGNENDLETGTAAGTGTRNINDNGNADENADGDGYQNIVHHDETVSRPKEWHDDHSPAVPGHSGSGLRWEWTEEDWRPFDDSTAFKSSHPLTRDLSLASSSVMGFSPTTSNYPQHPTGHALGMGTSMGFSLGDTNLASVHPDGMSGMHLGREGDLWKQLWDTVNDQSHRIATLEQDYRQLLLALPSQTRDHLNLAQVTSTFGNSDTMYTGHDMHNPRGFSERPLPVETSVLSPYFQHEENLESSAYTASVPTQHGVAAKIPDEPLPLLSNTSSTRAAAGQDQRERDQHGTLERSTAPLNKSSTSQPPPASNIGSSAAATTSTTRGNSNEITKGATTDSAMSAAKAAAGAAAKSFKVTLDDPCWKVLPAALKKYKINDDWRQYAMFICFGTTERCLSYDEKPLLLFQKLKESNQKPVFMLRHIRDIKSPIALAQQKQQARAQATAPETAKTGLSNPPLPSSGGNSPKSQTYSKDTRLHKPPVLQPISAKARAATATAIGSGSTTPGSGNQANFPDLPSPGMRQTAGSHSAETSLMPDDGEGAKIIGYAVAIYPYAAEKESEFEVMVGMAFVVLSKAKGWWVVQRDVSASGDVRLHNSKSGWVPSGCLLETSKPINPIPTSSSGSEPTSPLATPLANYPIDPKIIASSSFQGVALMDYDTQGEDELQLKTNESLRVFKRYAHWSYCVKNDGSRGWVPSWFVAKSHTSTSQLSSAQKAVPEGRKANKNQADAAGYM